jgi:hypothetical protein
MSKAQRRHFLIPVVYGGVVLLLVLLATFFRGYSDTVGDARLAGRYSSFPLFQSLKLDDLDISWHGMSFRFSRQSTPALAGVQDGDQGTDILFADGTRLRLTESSDSPGSCSITPVGSAGDGPLVIPFRVSGSLEENGPRAALSWKRGGQGYLLGLPAGAHADSAASLLTLPLGTGTGAISLRAAVASAPVVVPVRTARAATQPRLPDVKSMPTVEAFQAAMAKFADAAYSGWTGGRYSAADGLWKMPGGAPGFSENIGVGLLAESIARGTWAAALAQWTDAMARQERRSPDAVLPAATSPYAGGLREYAAALQASAADRVAQARSLLSKSDPALFSVPGLIPLLIDHGSADLLQGAFSLMTVKIAAGLDASLASGLLEGLLDYTREVAPNEELSRAARGLIDKAILPAVRTADAGVFLEAGGGRVDVKRSVRCGSILVRAGESLGYPAASAVGRGLVVSALALGSQDGTLPVSLVLSSGRLSAREGQQGPEEVYSLLPLDRRFPREVSVARALGQGSWLWTAARLVSAENIGGDAHLVLEYPVGTPHHFMIQNVRPFAAIRLHGIPWHTDPTYAKYSDGWAYDSGTRTLYVKLTGRQAREELDIQY